MGFKVEVNGHVVNTIAITFTNVMVRTPINKRNFNSNCDLI